MRILYFEKDKGYNFFHFKLQTLMLLLKIMSNLALTINFRTKMMLLLMKTFKIENSMTNCFISKRWCYSS